MGFGPEKGKSKFSSGYICPKDMTYESYPLHLQFIHYVLCESESHSLLPLRCFLVSVYIQMDGRLGTDSVKPTRTRR